MEEKNENKDQKLINIVKYNEQLINTITAELKLYQDDGLNDISLLILEGQISLIKFLKKLNVNYEKVNKVIEKDKQSGKKTTLKKMKKVVVEKKKGKKKKKSSSSESSSSEEEQKKKKTTTKKKAQSEKKKE